MTNRIQDFLRARRDAGNDLEPCLVVDLDVVRDNYQTFAKVLPDSRQGMKKPRVARFSFGRSRGQHLSQGMPLKVDHLLQP